MGRRRILGNRRLTARELASRHRARLDALGNVRVELTLSKQTLRTVEKEMKLSGNSRVGELRALVEEALAQRSGRRHRRSNQF